MLNDIEKVQSHNWRDISHLPKTTRTQVTTVEVTEEVSNDAVPTETFATVEVTGEVLDVVAPAKPADTIEVIEKVLNGAEPDATVEVVEKVLDDAKPTEPVNIVEATEEASQIKAPTPPRLTPKLESIYKDDVAFTRLLDLYLPSELKKRAESELVGLAETAVSQQALTWVADAENSPPQIQHWDSWGVKKDELVTSQGWKSLWRLGISERLAAVSSLKEDYEDHARVIQTLKMHLFSPTSATTNFHLILSDGVATLLLTHLHNPKIDAATRALFQHAYNRLTSPKPEDHWTSGLWMTERAGGSDLTFTETTATYLPLGPYDDAKDADGFPLGPWVLNGFKWFSTSTEGGMAVAVARTANGLSAFYVPMRRSVIAHGVATVELNGVRIRRLKKKMGTKGLPTGELELNGMRGWLIGKEGKGINEIGVVLNITRVHLAMSCVGMAGRGMAVSRAFARVRKVARGTHLSSVPLHMKTLAKAHVTYRAHLALTLFVAALLGKTEQQPQQTASQTPLLDLVPKNPQAAGCLLRLLGSVAKATAATDCTGILQTGMESLGGVGYLENDETDFNVARMFRDCCAVLIGEGTTDVIATDVIKILKGSIGPYVVQAYSHWITSLLPKKESMTSEAAVVSQQWSEIQNAISSKTMEQLTRNAREIMQRIAQLTSGVLLLADAARDDDVVAMEVARRWIQPAPLVSDLSVEQELALDQQIVFGDQPIWLGVA